MTEPRRRGDVQPAMRQTNWTIISLVGGLVLLVIIIAYLATNRNSDQDKLTNSQVSTGAPPSREKLCASKATYDLIKAQLFRRAAQVRGGDEAAHDKLSAFAVVRMENPVMESEDSSTGTVNCSGSLSLDLPPGVAVAGGRRSLISDVDYTVQQAADGSGPAVLLRNADAIITPLATLTRIAQPPENTGDVETNEAGQEQPEANAAASESAAVQPGPRSAYPGRPSFDCSSARSRGEIAVCSDAGLSALDLNMAAQYGRAISNALPDQRDVLRETARRFYAYRDRCPNRQCIADAYVGRMREIRDITEGRWQPQR